ncbi:MAG TPA: TIM barrel protein [Bryobacteraceae bacterium]|nr:TIM barrel protein [Bryobacteraceae bacterium]
MSALTDQIGSNSDEAIAFAHEYGLQFVEIRNRPGTSKEYFLLTEPEIKVDALRFVNEGIKISCVNTSLLRYAWPESEPTLQAPEEPDARQKRLAAEKARWDRRMEDLHKAIRCAQILGADKVRIFTGARVTDPRTMYQRIADTIGELALAAEKEKISLLIENDTATNAATSTELAAVMKLIPSKWVGIDWNPHNARGLEHPFPDAYQLLPKKRVLNVRVQAAGLLPDSADREDWKSILLALDRDDYKGKIGLETHIFDSTLIAAAHSSMEELMRIIREVS